MNPENITDMIKKIHSFLHDKCHGKVEHVKSDYFGDEWNFFEFDRFGIETVKDRGIWDFNIKIKSLNETFGISIFMALLDGEKYPLTSSPSLEDKVIFLTGKWSDINLFLSDINIESTIEQLKKLTVQNMEIKFGYTITADGQYKKL